MALYVVASAGGRIALQSFQFADFYFNRVYFYERSSYGYENQMRFYIVAVDDIGHWSDSGHGKHSLVYCHVPASVV